MGILELWLPIVVAAVAVFLVSSLLHVVLPWHKGDTRPLPREAEALDALRGTSPGQYMLPGCNSMQEMQTEEFKAKLQQGPVGFLILRRPGGSGMGAALGQWFVLTLVTGALVAYLATLALDAEADFGAVFRVTATAGILGYALSNVQEAIWKGQSWGVTMKFVVDGVIYGLVTGACFGWLWHVA